MNKEAKKLWMDKFPGGHFEFGEDYYDGYDAKNNHLVSMRRSGGGNWVVSPGFEPDGGEFCATEAVFGSDAAKHEEKKAAVAKPAHK